MLDSTAIITVLIGLCASIIVGAIKAGSDKIDVLPALAKQGLILVIAAAIVVGLKVVNLTTLPTEYQTALGTILQAIVAALTGIGLHNVKDGVTGNSTGVNNASH